MRLRFAVLVSLLTLVAVVAPSGAIAAPHHNHGLTINATPDPIITGDSVLVYGQLNGASPGGQTIVLYHRVNPSHHFSVIGTTTTNSFGFYEFTRAEGVVLTNRSWFVRAPALPGNIHSRTVHEHVAAALTLAASSATADTATPITFTGTIAPPLVHVGERVWLQQQNSSAGDDWHTIASGVIDANSSYSIPHRFVVPGDRDVRVAFRGDDRNIAAVSAPVTVSIQQAQDPTFTINTSAPIIDDGSPVTISGVLSLPPSTPGGTLVPDPNVSVTLWGRQDDTHLRALAHATTGVDGSYSFTQMPQHNSVYEVKTTFTPPPRRHTALLFEGVRDVVSIMASSNTSAVGQSVTFTGTVDPNKAGHVIELQRMGKDGDFHTIALRRINASSAYQFVVTFGSPGTKVYRTLVPGGPENVSGHSAPETITVSLPSINSLPPAS
jgi:hypothetical protein